MLSCLGGSEDKIFAEAPQSELFDYAVTVRSMTQGRGSYFMEFERYDQVPGNIAEKIIADHKAEKKLRFPLALLWGLF